MYPQPPTAFMAVVPDDAVDFPRWVDRKGLTYSVYVGTGGDLVAVDPFGSAIKFANVPSGTLLPIAIRRVNATSTSAADIVALFQR